jgi:hypothetical protein
VEIVEDDVVVRERLECDMNGPFALRTLEEHAAFSNERPRGQEVLALPPPGAGNRKDRQRDARQPGACRVVDERVQRREKDEYEDEDDRQ